VQRLHAGHDVGTGVSQPSAGRIAILKTDARLAGRRLSLPPHVGIRLDADDLFGPARPDAGGQTGAAADVHDQPGLLHLCQLGQHIDQHGRGRRAKSVVNIGEAGETGQVGGDGHGGIVACTGSGFQVNCGLRPGSSPV
jgi:hypothetical protein